MKKTCLAFATAALLSGCQTDGAADKTAEQKPQFGQPESTIPWNRPEQWEQSGALGQVPGMTGSGR